MNNKTTISLISLMLFIPLQILSQIKDSNSAEPYQFKITHEVESTSVKNQFRSGTCWTFATASFIESELLRLNKGKYDISEMYFVRMGYHDHAIQYVRFHGKLNFSSGAEGWDVMNLIRKYGFVTENAYPGLAYGETKHVHGEMDKILDNYVNAIIENKNIKLSPVWINAFDKILDTYLGDLPETFEVNSKSYSPVDFRDKLSFNPDDYIAITSFTHHPFYSSFIFESPDNWSFGKTYNVPIDELIQIIDNAIKNNYSIAWAADVSEKGFSFQNGLALIPQKEIKSLNGLEKSKWDQLSDKQKSNTIYSFDYYLPEQEISQEKRQLAYDNYQTTDDHLMHIIAIAVDQNGKKFYKVKNSWGVEGSKYNGFFFASTPYVKYKTMSIMLNKNALTKDMAKKLGLL